jgi:hypothetical protein
MRKPQNFPIFSLLRKPVFIIALMLMVIVMGSYAAQYYTWSVGYQITPLSQTKVVVDLGAHSGATSVPTIYYGGSETSPAVSVNVPAGKTLNIYAFIPQSFLEVLDDHFYSIRLKIYWKRIAPDAGPLNSWQVNLVSGGTHHYVRYESNIGLLGVGPGMDTTNIPPTISGAGGGTTWGFWFEVDNIWTGSVASSTGSVSFPIYVYATEA